MARMFVEEVPMCPDCLQRMSPAGYSGGAKMWTCACLYPAVADGATSEADIMGWERQHPDWKER